MFRSCMYCWGDLVESDYDKIQLGQQRIGVCAMCNERINESSNPEETIRSIKSGRIKLDQ